MRRAGSGMCFIPNFALIHAWSIYPEADLCHKNSPFYNVETTLMQATLSRLRCRPRNNGTYHNLRSDFYAISETHARTERGRGYRVGRISAAISRWEMPGEDQ